MRYSGAMAIDVVIGRNVHHKMWEQHITHRAVYEALGVTRFTLAKKMRGDIAWSAEDVAVAARVLGVSPCELFEGVTAQVTHEKDAGRSARVYRFPTRPRSWSRGVLLPTG